MTTGLYLLRCLVCYRNLHSNSRQILQSIFFTRREGRKESKQTGSSAAPFCWPDCERVSDGFPLFFLRMRRSMEFCKGNKQSNPKD